MFTLAPNIWKILNKIRNKYSTPLSLMWWTACKYKIAYTTQNKNPLMVFKGVGCTLMPKSSSSRLAGMSQCYGSSSSSSSSSSSLSKDYNKNLKNQKWKHFFQVAWSHFFFSNLTSPVLTFTMHSKVISNGQSKLINQ